MLMCSRLRITPTSLPAILMVVLLMCPLTLASHKNPFGHFHLSYRGDTPVYVPPSFPFTDRGRVAAKNAGYCDAGHGDCECGRNPPPGGWTYPSPAEQMKEERRANDIVNFFERRKPQQGPRCKRKCPKCKEEKSCEEHEKCKLCSGKGTITRSLRNNTWKPPRSRRRARRQPSRVDATAKIRGRQPLKHPRETAPGVTVRLSPEPQPAAGPAGPNDAVLTETVRTADVVAVQKPSAAPTAAVPTSPAAETAAGLSLRTEVPDTTDVPSEPASKPLEDAPKTPLSMDPASVAVKAATSDSTPGSIERDSLDIQPDSEAEASVELQ